jgi:hypothetical protein
LKESSHGLLEGKNIERFIHLHSAKALGKSVELPSSQRVEENLFPRTH